MPKAITVTLIARDEQDVQGIEADLRDSAILNNWPVCVYETRETTTEEDTWLRDEYGAE